MEYNRKIEGILHPIFFLIGASGAGKTTICEQLSKKLKEFQILFFDSIGVPSFAEMEEEYGSIEEWQRQKTLEWTKHIKKEFLGHKPVILDAQTRPQFIQEACSLFKIPHHVILFDCSDEERCRRLCDRGHPELANPQMLNWAKFLREECIKRKALIVDTTNQSIEETRATVIEALLE